jgi:hypothetical protein
MDRFRTRMLAEKVANIATEEGTKGARNARVKREKGRKEARISPGSQR